MKPIDWIMLAIIGLVVGAAFAALNLSIDNHHRIIE